MKGLGRAGRAQRGFALIEPLMVVLLVGMLAAMVFLGATSLMGKSTLQSANEEATMVRGAIKSCLSDAGAVQFDAASYTWNGDNTTTPKATVRGTVYQTSDYLETRNALKAWYTIDQSGSITSATNTGWGGTFTWNVTQQKWQ